ncbi:MAG: two-component system response regulator [Anaerolineae bacterium]
MAKVLIVDDNKAFLDLTAAFLSLDGLEVLTTDNAQKTLDLVREQRPDIVLLDIVMPGMDGYQVCREIKEDPATRDTLIVMMTALAGSSRAYAREVGADAYIAKPVPSRELRETIQALLDHQQADRRDE